MRLSLDSKATVLIGPFSRGGQSRTGHPRGGPRLQARGALTPFGIFRPQTESALFFTDSKVTSDFMVDCLEQWIEASRGASRRSASWSWTWTTGRRTQPAQPVAVAAGAVGAEVRDWLVVLVYYPPYHSKYNPIERLWGLLENYWRGELLDSEAAVLGYAGNMTYNGVHPQVRRVGQTYTKVHCGARRR